MPLQSGGLDRKWIALTLLVVVMSFGLKSLIGILCCVLGLVGGLIIGIYLLGKQEETELEARFKKVFSSVPNYSGIFRIKTAVVDTKPLPSLDHRLTGDPVIDEALGEVLTYVMRDFISSWYSRISGDQTFQNAIYCAMQRICRRISARVREVNWINFLTMRMVDDFASHIRLYRRACETVAERRRRAPMRGDSPFRRSASFGNSAYKLESSGRQDATEHYDESEEALATRREIEAVFFELEKEMEAAAYARQSTKLNATQPQTVNPLAGINVCISRERVASDQATLRDFAQALSEALLYLVVDSADFQNRPLRCIIREVLANQVLVPTLNAISDPDYVNLTVVRLCKPTSLTSEAFFSVLQSSESLDELVSVQQKLEIEIARQRSQDVGDVDDSFVKATLQNLNYLSSLCTVRIQKLKNEQYKMASGSTSAGSPSRSFGSGTSVGAASKLRRLQILRTYPSIDSDSQQSQSQSHGQSHALLSGRSASMQSDFAPTGVDAVSFDTLMNKSSALAYFLEFLRANDDDHYLLFYLSLDGFRISVEQRINQLRIKQSLHPDEDLPELDYDAIRDEALILFEQFVDTDQLEAESNEKDAEPRRRRRVETVSEKRPFSRLDRLALRNTWKLLKTRQPNEDMFDDLLQKLSSLLQGGELFGAFRRSELHARMLRDLELDSDADDDESVRVEPASILTESTELEQTLVAEPMMPLAGNQPETAHAIQLVAQITQTDIVRCETSGAASNKQFAIYTILMQLIAGGDVLRKWMVQRRFSDFDHLHSLLEQLAAATSGSDVQHAFGIVLRKPEKRAFNMSKAVFDKRRVELQNYLTTLLPVVSRMLDGSLNDENGQAIRDAGQAYVGVAGEGVKHAEKSTNMLLYELVVQQFLEPRCADWEKVQLPKTIRRPSALTKALNVFGLSSTDSGNVDNSSVRRMGETQARSPASPNAAREPSDELSTQLMTPLQKTANFINSLTDQSINAVNAATNSGWSAKEQPKFLNTLTNLVATNASGNPVTTSNNSGGQSVLDTGKVALGLDQDDNENIPLRILLLMVDEVFEMRHRNQWLRRRLVVILKQILKSIMGDTMNRKIVEYVESLTNAESIAHYIRQLLASFWPSQMLVDRAPERDYYTKMRTRVVCKTKLLGSIPEELRPLLGAEVTKQGIFRLVGMLQHTNLNRRLALVVLEGILQTMFPSNQLETFFQHIYTVSVEQAGTDGRPSGVAQS